MIGSDATVSGSGIDILTASTTVPDLTPSERRALRARAHHLQPVVIVGNAGLTPEVIREIETNLKSHELIKVRLMAADRQERTRLAAEICDRTGAHPVQHIGKIIVVYRARPPEEGFAPTRHRIRKPVKKTKRSYQTR